MKRSLLALAVLLLALPSAVLAQEDRASALREAEAANRAALKAYAADVTVVARKTVPRKDFHLWYGHLADRSWTPDGNWWPAGEQTRIFARRNAAGDLDIVWSEPRENGLWSVPAPVSADAVSAGNEIYPMRSPDGRRLYFASDGLFGMGGYDLYVATWDPRTRTWGAVRNMGFPFNSEADDLLFCDTEDGRYSVFASNRDCGRDSIVIYVLRQEEPVSAPISPAQVAARAKLAVTAPDNGYPFVRRSPGSAPDLRFEEPVEEEDLTFRIDKTGAFARNNTLPSGIVYQIQLFVVSNQPAIKQLKGVRPVYAHRQKSGKTMYAAGMFRTYAEAETALAAVRKAGHKNAIITAFEDGQPLPLKQARQKESSVKVVTEEVRIVK